MAGYRYRISVEPLTDRQGEPSVQDKLVFEVENHDDLLNIVERMRSREDLDFGTEKTAALAVGLKLFSEVMMEHRKHPLFAPLRDAWKAFMINLKKGPNREGAE